jgi:hypothetical protein
VGLADGQGIELNARSVPVTKAQPSLTLQIIKQNNGTIRAKV